MSQIKGTIITIEEKYDAGQTALEISQDLNLDIHFVQQVIDSYETAIREIEDYPDEF